MSSSERPAILVVDDEGEILYSLRGLLRKEYDFHAAQSGYEGLQVVDRTPVHVVVADQRMPEMTGVDFLAQVRARYPDVTRLLLTGYADLPAVIDAINEGHVFRYITKPWDQDALRLVLREACEEHDQVAERRRLLTDLNAYLGRCLELLKGLQEGSRGTLTPEARAEAEQLTQGGTALLGRIGPALR
ncbi:MAG TPA: response regulator [Gemmataceae bacterium]|nr:response regulator [Gemmataceae bacterium]